MNTETNICPPVLLITFNRPDYTIKMLKALKEAGVSKLFVFRDGPRPFNDEDVKATEEIERIILNKIDWPCDVSTNFMTNNLGCGYGPYSAISWAFQYVDELCILEDDCIPTPSFFRFCGKMLDLYRNNLKIRLISGRQHLESNLELDNLDYIFTQYAITWGWATWKRSWKNFDLQLRGIEGFFHKGGFKKEFATIEESNFFNKRYKECKKDISLLFHIWDYHYGLFNRVNGSLGIAPAKNLIKYIGIDGTHPISKNSPLLINADEEILKGVTFNNGPSKIEINQNYDKAMAKITLDFDYLYNKYFARIIIKPLRWIKYKICNKI